MEDENKSKGQASSDVSRMQREVVELRAMNTERARVEEQLQVQLATMSGINRFCVTRRGAKAKWRLQP